VTDLFLPAAPGSAAPSSGRKLTIRAPQRTYVTRLLAASGFASYEPTTLACFLAAIECCAAENVFDIGANVGVFSWLAAALTHAAVIAFEPTPDLANQMLAICSANSLVVKVEAFAIGAAPGLAELYLSDTTDSSNSLRAGFRPSHRSITVPIETLDGYVERTGSMPDVLKIDTESTEPDVLRGASNLLVTHRPWIICEVLAGRTEAELMRILEPHDYHYYRIDGEGPLQVRTTIVGDESYVHMNWLFAPSNPSRSFWAAMVSWYRSLAVLPHPLSG
jgi:FkbM family methyltransferase